MTTVTLRNNFHNTECRVRPDANGVLSPSQVKRVRRALCGIKDCTCGHGPCSTRGPQDVEIDYHGSRTAIIRSKE